MARPDVSDERKEQVLNAAAKVFARLGFHRARIEDIAQEAQLSKGLLYWYFKNKDEIIIAILKRYFNLANLDFETLKDQNKTVQERLSFLIANVINSVEEMINFLPLNYEFYAIATREPEVRNFLKKYFEAYRVQLAGLINEGIKNGEFRTVDADEVAISLISLLEGCLLLNVVSGGSFDWQKQMKSSFNLLINGIAKND